LVVPYVPFFCPVLFLYISLPCSPSLVCLRVLLSVVVVVLIKPLMQTDIMDLLGSDLPVESDEGIKFAWSDGILLQVKMNFLKVSIVSILL
jgi:hypothetical protein